LPRRFRFLSLGQCPGRRFPGGTRTVGHGSRVARGPSLPGRPTARRSPGSSLAVSAWLASVPLVAHGPSLSVPGVAHGPSVPQRRTGRQYPSGARAISTRVAHGPSVPRADWRTGRLLQVAHGPSVPQLAHGPSVPERLCVRSGYRPLVVSEVVTMFDRDVSVLVVDWCLVLLARPSRRLRPNSGPRRRPGPSVLVWRRPWPATCGRVASSESPARAPIPPLIHGGLAYGPRHILAPQTAPDPSPCLRLKAPFTGYQVGSWGWYRARDRVEASVFIQISTDARCLRGTSPALCLHGPSGQAAGPTGRRTFWD
jgi:hypothetical protein